MKRRNQAGKGNSSNDGEKQAGKSKLRFAQKITLSELIIVALHTAAPQSITWQEALRVVGHLFVRRPSPAQVLAALDELVQYGVAEHTEHGWRLKQASIPAHDGEQPRSDVMSPEVRALADSLDRFSCVVTRAVGLLRFMPDEFWNIAESKGVSKNQMDIVESFGFLGDDSADLLNAALEDAWDKLMPIRVKDAQRKRD